ncbi:MbnP family protein [Lunatimonas salinarum]|uniref:MbnP family protein n=1 Tax=Lunatimonas salinarum TaxID=1774590 RepID=UPI001FD7FB1C|nr:MbnP family protein [Lunatimonas salinarum]
MKYLRSLYYKCSLVLISVVFFACQETEDPILEQQGEMIVKFDNYVGNQTLVLDEVGSTNFRYSNAKGQSFNITQFGYYISHVKLEGPNGETYLDEMNASADASLLKGYYRVVQGDPDTYQIHLKDIPAGQYNKITFTLGIREDGIQEGAVGGILDRAAGGWFWNWNSGFIHYLFEGHSPVSPREEQRLRLHIGGWKNVPAIDENPQRFFDNNVEISLLFDATVQVSETMRPSPHIHMDLLEVIGDADFTVQNNIHSPSDGVPFAQRIRNAFIVDHTHQ